MVTSVSCKFLPFGMLLFVTSDSSVSTTHAATRWLARSPCWLRRFLHEPRRQVESKRVPHCERHCCSSRHRSARVHLSISRWDRRQDPRRWKLCCYCPQWYCASAQRAWWLSNTYIEHRRWNSPVGIHPLALFHRNHRSCERRDQRADLCSADPTKNYGLLFNKIRFCGWGGEQQSSFWLDQDSEPSSQEGSMLTLEYLSLQTPRRWRYRPHWYLLAEVCGP